MVDNCHDCEQHLFAVRKLYIWNALKRFHGYNLLELIIIDTVRYRVLRLRKLRSRFIHLTRSRQHVLNNMMGCNTAQRYVTKLALQIQALLKWFVVPRFYLLWHLGKTRPPQYHPSPASTSCAITTFLFASSPPLGADTRHVQILVLISYKLHRTNSIRI